ncbi:hypothetical protein FHW84_001780 [Dyella sp. SG562]|uniref:hypothetical protein n=1 Tax=Dyella sp. SG562 TaxID=2587017 RepID=UPI0014229D64|nr:hypothetical protein [Dyella sp. SG562]NII73211.1 hypothetical protein [Dyella sp. SG562]
MTKHHEEIQAAAKSAAVEMAAETMTGDLLAACVDELKIQRDVWAKLNEQDQQEAIYRLSSRITDNVRQAVEIIASGNRPTIVATVESVTVKDGIKAVLTLQKHDAHRHELIDAAGQSVLLIVAGASEFYGGTENVKPDPDQTTLSGFGEGEQPMQDAA